MKYIISPSFRLMNWETVSSKNTLTECCIWKRYQINSNLNVMVTVTITMALQLQLEFSWMASNVPKRFYSLMWLVNPFLASWMNVSPLSSGFWVCELTHESEDESGAFLSNVCIKLNNHMMLQLRTNNRAVETSNLPLFC